uniref:Fumarate lyase N-terminal domain-containing protein n=1 Tax=Ignisphaera aggregans TaxID=334771 RepID=A0A7C4NKI4_9CREN
MLEVLMGMNRYKFLVGGESKNFTDMYTSSFEFDRTIAKYVAMVLLVHVRELVKKKLIEINSAKAIIRELVDIAISNGEKLYSWAKNRGEVYEDIFEALELYLYDLVGPDAGRIAVGRSRNDHIATVLRLALRDKVLDVIYKILGIRKILIDKALEYKDKIFPFYTHAQVAQCGSAAQYFLAYEQAFTDIYMMLMHSLNYLGKNPLGSGAATGSMVQLNLTEISEELCLSAETLPPYYATGSRLFLLYVLSLLSLAMSEIGRFVEDMILLANVLQQGVEIAKHHVSTSSIMPHKRNLVTLEIARAKASKVLGSLSALISIYKSVPYGYNLDFQEMNFIAFEAIKDVEETFEIVKDFIAMLGFKEDVVKDYLKDKPCWSSDLIEYIAITAGKPVRELYAELAKALQKHLVGGDDSLKQFLARYGIEKEEIISLYRVKPFEKSLDQIIDHALKRLQENFKEVEQVNVDLKRCNEMLIRDYR